MNFDAIRLSARTLRKQPVFTVVVILSLALAIALNTTMYGVLDAMAHPHLDLRKPEQLYWVQFYGDFKFTVDNHARDAALQSGMHDVTAMTSAGRSLATGPYTLIEHGQSVVEGSIDGVAANYFDVVGPRLIAGRTFIPADAEQTNTPLVLGEETAAHLFPDGSSPIGATVSVDRVPHVVVGVVSAQSAFPHSGTKAWGIAPFANRSTYSRLIRLRDGATRADGERELSAIAARIAATSGESTRDVAFRFHQAADPEFQARPFHYALIFAVCAVLLVACANLANLQLARGIGRRRDLALRAALGATRGRIVRHLLTESALLAVGGLALGLLFTYLGGQLLTASIPPSMGAYVMQPQMSWRVLAFALLATIMSLVLIGLAPAIYVSKADPNEMLKSGAGTGATRKNRRRYGLLVGVEIALALALSSAAALSVRVVLAGRGLTVGYDPSHMATGFVMSNAKRGGVVHYSEVLQSLAVHVKAAPGVVEAAAVVSRGVIGGAISVEDAGGAHEYLTGNYGVELVTPSYLRTFGYTIVQGRDFLDGERDEGAVIIDEQTAHVLWPNANPVGAQIKFGDLKSNLPFVRVVGVLGEQKAFAEDPRMVALYHNVRKLGQIIYLPGPADSLATMMSSKAQFFARGAKPGASLALSLRQFLQLRGEIVARSVQPMDEMLSITRDRQSASFISSLFSLFAVVGIGLAAFGVYGVVAHSVAERRRELGVRIALGATSRDILHAVLRESVVVALAGVAIGLLLTKYAKVYLAPLAREDDLYNAPLFAGVALVLLAATVVAAMIPAMRATRVDPTESLRNE